MSRREWAVQVWDRLMAAGAEHGIAPGGYRALESLRLEKGYRYFGTDLTSSDTPYESGLGFCVALDKGEFNGRAALSEPGATEPARAAADADRRRRGLPDDLRRRGGPPRWDDRRPHSQLRLRLHGLPQRGARDRARRPRRGNRLTVDVFGDAVPARIERDVLYDPDGERIRG